MDKDPQFDKENYEAVQTHLKAAFEHMVAAGRSARDFSEFTLEKFGDSFLPYLRQFYDDVGNGRIKITGLTKATRTAILGPQISPEEREELIRVAAFVRAEQRGFTGSSAEEDWYAAEREVDEQLARKTGLVSKGHKALTSATTLMDKELGNIKKTIAAWLEDAGDTRQKAKKTVKKTSQKVAT